MKNESNSICVYPVLSFTPGPGKLSIPVRENKEPVEKGKFKPEWQSLYWAHRKKT